MTILEECLQGEIVICFEVNYVHIVSFIAVCIVTINQHIKNKDNTV